MLEEIDIRAVVFECQNHIITKRDAFAGPVKRLMVLRYIEQRICEKLDILQIVIGRCSRDICCQNAIADALLIFGQGHIAVAVEEHRSDDVGDEITGGRVGVLQLVNFARSELGRVGVENAKK